MRGRLPVTLFSAISAAVINQGSQWEQSDLTQPTLTILLPFLRLQFWRESQLLQGNQQALRTRSCVLRIFFRHTISYVAVR